MEVVVCLGVCLVLVLGLGVCLGVSESESVSVDVRACLLRSCGLIRAPQAAEGDSSCYDFL